jgi:hypothetical protein
VSTTAELFDLPSEEALRVREWRARQFRTLGFEGIQAELLAEAGHVDLGQVRALVAAGCELGTALRIVL